MTIYVHEQKLEVQGQQWSNWNYKGEYDQKLKHKD
jgi:hypothetical protein